jgi:outer membrane immunogenic protein
MMGLALASFVSVGGASAADMYAPGGMKDPYVPFVSWSGFYVGLNGGGAWSDVDVSASPSFSYSGSGAAGGAQFGYNWTRGRFVYGFEVDAGGFDIGSHKLGRSIESGFFADATARLGYTFDRTLIYAKGGAAFYEGTVKFGGATNSDDLWGGTIGGGIEYLLSPTWSVKAEYQFFDFNSVSVAGVDNELTVNVAKVGVNLHFPPKESFK